MQTKITATVFLALFALVTVSQAQNSNGLSKKDQAIVPIAAFTATGEINKLKVSFAQGLDDGLTVNEIKEILVHLYAYAGFPRALNGINAFISVMEDRKAKGIKDTIGRKASPKPSDYDPNAYGHKTRNTLVGKDISKRTSGYPVFTPIIDKFLVEHLFADIFVRDVLSRQERELVTISILSAMTGTEPQLKGHLGIAMRMGYSEYKLKDFIAVLKANLGVDTAQRANQVLGSVLGKSLPPVGPTALKVIKKGAPVKAAADHFTGTATVESRFASQATHSYGGGIVNFDAGARTAWHTHPIGQTLIVISGHGLVQSEGEAVEHVFSGDVVWIPANERHWHGAAPGSAMSHVAISEPRDGSTVKWMEHVSKEQYSKEL
ncbi:MAG: carboxymuconolactone decarboxylase family protein [Desulfobacter postgatei]|uniref:(R)-mandelonitrile lyase n=1 Tax=Desulfobacter postgatei TaxID=2293 RepID=UPI0023F082DF|nr:carboxymuconolactone decarboxylase family protein [Desulfobacter postgatei]MDD4275031.1 carboxymuconolactone decarboxylase family protein [Desulfobacter postgatei]